MEMSATTSTGELPALRDVLWARARNSLGIARLLAHEGRPEPLVATACNSAVEAALRAALEHSGQRYEGDLVLGLARLEAPLDLWDGCEPRPRRQWLSDAERAVGWISDRLRREAPERSWGF